MAADGWGRPGFELQWLVSFEREGIWLVCLAAFWALACEFAGG